MKQEIINSIIQEMLRVLDNSQLIRLKRILEQTLDNYEIKRSEHGTREDDGVQLLSRFIAAKRVEGCSDKTLKYYQSTIEMMISSLKKNIRQIVTEDLRSYLTDYQNRNQSSHVTIDNIRRILSSFFSWLEDEDYIVKSPVRRIHKVKTASNIKETYTDEGF